MEDGAGMEVALPEVLVDVVITVVVPVVAVSSIPVAVEVDVSGRVVVSR